MTVIACVLWGLLAVAWAWWVRRQLRVRAYRRAMVAWARAEYGDGFAEVVQAIFKAGPGWNIVRLGSEIHLAPGGEKA